MSHVRETAKPGDLRGVRVLVVEDQWHVANALRSLLEVEGMEVSGPAGKTADAHRLADEHKPELAVVDINLKGEMAYSLIDNLHDLGVRASCVISRLCSAAAIVGKGRCRPAETLQWTGTACIIAPRTFVGVAGDPAD